MDTLNSTDFKWRAGEVQEIFKHIVQETSDSRISQMQVPIVKLLDQTMIAVKAITIEKIRYLMGQKGKQLEDLMFNNDRSKTQMLKYQEFENMLLDIPCSVKPNTMNELLINQMLDPSKRLGQISFDTIRKVFATRSNQFSGDGGLDLKPGKDKESAKLQSMGSLNDG